MTGAGVTLSKAGTLVSLTVTDHAGTGKTGSSGTFTVDAASHSAYKMTAASTTPAAGATDALTITAVDQYGNTVTSVTGDQSLTFSGLSNAPAGTVPTVTDKTGSATNQGTATAITFTNGVSSAGGVLKAYKAEGPVTLNATDGTHATTSTGGAGVSLTVASTGTQSAYWVTAASGTPAAGATDQLTIAAVDQYGNTVTSVSGSKSLTFSGLSTTGGTPTVTNASGSAINQGTATAITFTSGVSSAGGVLVAYTSGSQSLHVTDGTYTSTGTGGSGDLSLTVGAGSHSAYKMTAASTTPAAGATDALTITAVDQYGNTVTSVTGLDESLTFSGLSTTGGTPTVTNKSGSAINQGTTTAITFTSGVSSAGGVLVAYTSGSQSLHATDGTHTSTGTGGSGDLSLTVGAGSHSAYKMTAASTTPAAGATDALTITAVDQYGNTVTSVTGLDESLTFSGLSTTGGTPTVTNKSGSAINQGTATAITFTRGEQCGRRVGGVHVGVAVIARNGRDAHEHGDWRLGRSIVDGGSGVAQCLQDDGGEHDAGGRATDALTITAVDQYGNTVTSVTGDQSLTFSGLSNAPAGTVPTVTDKTGSATNQGTATAITFTNGVSSAGGVLKAYKAEGPVTLNATDARMRRHRRAVRG